MLLLQNLTLNLSTLRLAPQTSKHLRISTLTSSPSTLASSPSSMGTVRTTTQPCKYINEQCLKWEQSLHLPLLNNQQLLFEIFDVHQFGFHPQELEGVLAGRIAVDGVAGGKQASWQVCDSVGGRVGFLGGEIVTKIPPLMKNLLSHSLQFSKSSTNSPNPNPSCSYSRPQCHLLIKSIIIQTFPEILKNCHLSLSLGNKTIKSHKLSSLAGQLVYIEPTQFILDHSSQHELKVQVIHGERDQDQEEGDVVGEAVLAVFEDRVDRRGKIFRGAELLGEIYVEGVVGNRSKIINSKFVIQSRSPKKNKILSTSLNSSLLIQKTHTPTSSSMLPPHSAHNSVHSLLHSLHPSPFPSIVSHNSNIKFPKQKRFLQLGETHNEKVSYLKDRSMEFGKQRVGEKYRGASIGYGGKIDFGKQARYVPGVGDYRLPSIWDRY